jgi:hypothetical protein
MAVDIMPGTFPNNIKQGSKGGMPVAIFGTPTFNATQVVPTAVKVANATVKLKIKGVLQYSFSDVNHDGHMDMVVQVQRQELGLTQSDVSADLTGMTTTNQPIFGSDSVLIVK